VSINLITYRLYDQNFEKAGLGDPIHLHEGVVTTKYESTWTLRQRSSKYLS